MRVENMLKDKIDFWETLSSNSFDDMLDIFVRSMGFYFYGKEYSGNMRGFLDDTCKKLNKDWNSVENDCQEASKDFSKSIEFVHDVFGENSFRVYSSNKYSRQVNRAVIDIMIHYFMKKEIRKKLTGCKSDIVKQYQKISSDQNFKKSVSFSTNSSWSVDTRFSMWADCLNSLDDDVNLNSPLLNLQL